MANDEWYTPDRILKAVRDVLGEINLDPASCDEAQLRVRAKRHFTIKDDALKQQWWGNVFLNPPFSRGNIGKFADKILEEFASGRVTQAIVLVDNCADTRWFRKLARAATMICFTEGRIKFITPDGKVPGSPPKGQCFFYLGSSPDRFEQRFKLLGLVGKLSRRKAPSRRLAILRTLHATSTSTHLRHAVGDRNDGRSA